MTSLTVNQMTAFQNEYTDLYAIKTKTSIDFGPEAG